MRHEWKPIETAPRDGTRVLVWIDDKLLDIDGTNIQFAKLWFYDDGSLGGGASGFYGKYNITHWMPLPDSPINITRDKSKELKNEV